MFTYNLQSLHYYFDRILAYLLGRETEQLLLIYVVISFCREPRLTGNQLVLLVAKTCLLTLKKLKRSHIKRSNQAKVYIHYNKLLVLYAYLSIVSACICIILLFNNLIKILLK